MSRFVCVWFYEKPRAICPGVKWVDPTQPQMIFWLKISSCREEGNLPSLTLKALEGLCGQRGRTLDTWVCCSSATNELCDWKLASSPLCAPVSSPLKWVVGGTDDLSKPFQLKHSMILHRAVYVICRAQSKMKMQGFLQGKNFKTARAEHEDKHRILLSTGPCVPGQMVCSGSQPWFYGWPYTTLFWCSICLI